MNAEPAFQFTQQQRAVINHAGGALLVAAGPGTGKTRVIVERIAHLVEHHDAKPTEILALTFSRSAATEMMHRVARRLGEGAGAITFSTFHSFSLGLIHQHHSAFGYPTPPRVITIREQVELIRRILATTRGPMLHPITLLSKRSFGARIIAEALVHVHERSNHITDSDLHAALESIASEYRNLRRTASLVDHPAMVPEAVELLEHDTGLAHTLQQQFRFVLVDEYQDTSTTQIRLLELLAPPPTPLMVVGDDDQSIYAFRGATPNNLQAFAESRDAERIDLTENWRCGAHIQDAATTLINHNTSRIQKTIRAHPTTGNGTIDWLRYNGIRAHARGLAELIDDELRQNGRTCRDIAVLWRTQTHPLAELLLDHLLQLGIPARTSQGVSHAVGLRSAIAALIDLHHHIDDQSPDALTAILESGLSGMNPILTQHAQREARRTRRSLDQTVKRLSVDNTSYQPMLDTLDAIERVRQTCATTTPDFMHVVWLEFPGLHTAARALLSTDLAIANPARQIIGAVTALTADAEAFALANPAASLSDWAIQLRQDMLVTDDLIEGIDTVDNTVLLLTVHQAKGLEWPVVITPGMEEGVFPSRHRESDLLRDAMPSLTPHFRDASIEEERRLLYVALTRAKERAVVSFDPEGQQRPASPSRFLNELGILPVDATPDGRPRTSKEVETELRQQLRRGTPIDRAAAASALGTLSVQQRRRWWAAVPPVTTPTPAPPDDHIDTTVTALTDFRACPFRFRCQHILGLRAPLDAPRGMGTIVHKVLQDFHAPDAIHPFEVSTLRNLLEVHWDHSQFLFAPIAEQSRRDALEYIDRYIYHHPTRHHARAVEQAFTFSIAGLNISGKVDAIFTLPEGTEIVDFKTGRTPMSTTTAKDDLQLGLYSLAFDHATELESYASPHRAVYLYLSALKSPEESDRARPTTIVDGTRLRATNPADRETVASKLEGYATSIRNRDFPTKNQLLARDQGVPPGDLEIVQNKAVCEYCDFRRLCPDYSTTPT